MKLLLTMGLVSLAACGLRADSEFVEAVPDFQGLALELTGDASEAMDALAPQDGELAVMQRFVVETTAPEYLARAQKGIAQLNSTLRAALSRVRALVDASEGQPGPVAGSRVWGPTDVGEVTWRLTVRRLSLLRPGEEGTRYGWRLQGKPLGAEDTAYRIVMGGALLRATTDEAHRGRGVMGIALDELAAIDATFPGQGSLLAGYAHNELGKALSYVLREFTPDPAQYAPVTAAFVGHRLSADQQTAVRLAIHTDLQHVPANTEAKELLRIRARYIPGVGGRAAALATGGDIPEGEAYVGASCWNAGLEETYKWVRRCVTTVDGRSCETVHLVGTPEACQLDETATREPSEDPLDTTFEDDAPATDIEVPTEVPSGDA